MFLDALIIWFRRELMFDESLIVLFLINQGDAVMVLSDIFWTTSRCLQSHLEMSAPQAGPAYVRFGIMYSLCSVNLWRRDR